MQKRKESLLGQIADMGVLLVMFILILFGLALI